MKNEKVMGILVEMQNIEKDFYSKWATDTIIQLLRDGHSLAEIIQKDLIAPFLSNTDSIEQKNRGLRKAFKLLCEHYNLTMLAWTDCIIENIPYSPYDTSKMHPILSHALLGIYPYSILPNSNKRLIEYLKEHPFIREELREFISDHKKNKGQTPDIKTQFRLIDNLIRVARELQIKSFAEVNGHEGYIRLLNHFKKHRYQCRTSAVVSVMCFFGERSNSLKITNPVESQKVDDARQPVKKRASAFRELSEDSYHKKTKKIDGKTFVDIQGVTREETLFPREIDKITSLLPTPLKDWEKLDTPALQKIYTYLLNIICALWSIFTLDRPVELGAHVRTNIESSILDDETDLKDDSIVMNNYDSSDNKKRTNKLFPVILSSEVRKLIRIQNILAQRLNVQLQPIKEDGWINSGIPIFLDENLKYIGPEIIKQRMRETLDLVGLNHISPYATLYWTRKGGISLVANNTTSLKWISEITGTNIETLIKHYIYALNNAKEKYLEFLKKTGYAYFNTTAPEASDEDKHSLEFKRGHKKGFADALAHIKNKTGINLPITEFFYKNLLEQSTSEEQFFTTEDLLHLFGLSKNTIKLYRDKNLIKYKKVGNKYFYEKRSTLNFKKHLSSYEAASVFNMSRRNLQNLIKKGTFKETIQPNGNRIVPIEELLRYFVTKKLGWKVDKDTLNITITIAD